MAHLMLVVVVIPLGVGNHFILIWCPWTHHAIQVSGYRVIHRMVRCRRLLFVGLDELLLVVVGEIDILVFEVLHLGVEIHYYHFDIIPGRACRSRGGNTTFNGNLL